MTRPDQLLAAPAGATPAELPLQELPDQDEPLQEFADHDEPLQLDPLQATRHEPLHELPDQDEPFQIPPDQLEPAASSAAIAAELKGMPKMSCSPWSTTPFIEMWSVPREASSEPVPVAGALYCCERERRRGNRRAPRELAHVELAAALLLPVVGVRACRSSRSASP